MLVLQGDDGNITPIDFVRAMSEFEDVSFYINLVNYDRNWSLSGRARCFAQRKDPNGEPTGMVVLTISKFDINAAVNLILNGLP